MAEDREGPVMPRPKCDECLGCPPHHAPTCSQNTQAERERADAEYRCWYGDDYQDDADDQDGAAPAPIPRVDDNGWHYLLRFPDRTVVQCAGDWDVAHKHLRLINSDGSWPAGGRFPTLIGAYGPNAVGGPEGRGGVYSYGYTPNLIGSIDHPREEWTPA